MTDNELENWLIQRINSMSDEEFARRFGANADEDHGYLSGPTDYSIFVGFVDTIHAPSRVLHSVHLCESFVVTKKNSTAADTNFALAC